MMTEYDDIPISYIAWHEAGHALFLVLSTGNVPSLLSIVGNGRRGGFCGTYELAMEKMSPFARIAYDAAGEAGEDLQARLLTVPRPRVQETPPSYDPATELPPTVSALAALMIFDSNTADATDAEPLKTDHLLVREVLDGLVKDGRIRERKDMLDRWFARAKYTARKALQPHWKDLLKLAQALTRYQYLLGIQIRFILDRDGPGWWALPDPHPLNAKGAFQSGGADGQPLAPTAPPETPEPVKG